ncbi:MATE family efflux transporter [Paraburkholderia flava]|uniref:MATE family efflux transporter n=1 Tax=Paraburkholderia flava TaxID=2547393 RepID=UPI00197EB841|nr:MATE family efflux transporter [Paraburkholderia flava]
MSDTVTLAPTASKPLWKTYFALLLPMMLTNVLQSAAGTIDGIYLGQMIGVDAIAAVSAFFPVFFFLLAIIIGLSTGATVLIGHAWGAGDRARVRAIAGTALAMMMCAGLVIAVIGGIFAGPLMHALGTPTNVVDDATRYARLMLVGMPVVFLLWLTTSMSRGVGDAMTPLWTLALATAIALVCTPTLIRGWFGLPRLGVASPAVSTLIAFALAMLWTALRWRRTTHPLAPDAALWRTIRIDRGIARKILRIGVPASLQMLTMAIAEIVLLGLVNRHGSHATAAYGAVNQVMSWMQLPAMSLGITASILASHAIGAGRVERLGRIVQTGLVVNVVVTGLFVAAAYALAPTILGFFLADGTVIALALRLLHIVAWSVVVLGLANVLVGTMRASGAVFAPTALAMFAIVCIELPVAYWLNARVGMQGIWWAYALTFVAMLGLQAGYCRVWWWRRWG